MAQPTTAAELRNKAPQPPVDPNVVLPKAVRDAGKRSEVIQRAINGEAEPSVAEPNAPPPNGQEPPPAVPPPVVMAPPPSVQPSGTPTAPVAGQNDAEVPPEEWRNRFFSMKGRFDRLAEQVGVMGDTVQRLQTENASLRTVQQPPELAQPLQLISQQEIDDYGPEFVDMVRRAAAEIAGPLQTEVQQLRSQLGTVQAETGNSFLTRMHATIAGMVPNWQDLNRDQRFIAWVQLPDMFSGAIRQSLMQEAWNSGDAHRVAAFFRAFLAEEAAVDPRIAARGQPQAPAPAAAPPAAVPGVNLGTRLSLDQLAAPGRAQSSAHMPADKPVYTAQDITRFYTEVSAGKWRTREAERAAIDADIITAQHEGRIILDQRTVRPMDWNGNR